MKSERKSGSFKRILALLLAGAMALSVTACGVADRQPDASSSQAVYTQAEQEAIQSELLSLCDDILVTEYTNNPYAINSQIVHPEKLGLGDVDAGAWNSETLEAAKSSMAESDAFGKRLEEIDENALADKQKILYAQLTAIYVGESDESTILYDNKFDPAIGVQGKPGGNLRRFQFREKADIEDYFQLMRSISDYFDGALSFANEQEKEQLLPNDIQLDAALEQCDAELEEQADHYLIASFEEKIQEAEFLTEKEKTAYIKKHNTYLKKYYFPAFESLKASLIEMKTKDDAQRPDRICDLENGKEYYEFMMQSTVGTDRSVLELKQEMNKYMNEVLDEYISSNGDTSDPPVDLSDTKALLTYMQEQSKADFPEMPNVDYRLTTISKAEENMTRAIALFQIPPIDEDETMTIYLGSMAQSGDLYAATVVCHEGIPGHMYLRTVRKSEVIHPLQNVISFIGAEEGWCNYIEQYILNKYLNATESEKAVCADSNTGLLLHDVLSVKIHYEGGTKEDVRRAVKKIYDEEYWDEKTDAIYEEIISNPFQMLPYTAGMTEILALKEETKEALGDAYTDKLFHTFFVESGAQDFTTLREMLPEFAAKHLDSAEKAA